MQDHDWKALLAGEAAQFKIELTSEQLEIFGVYLKEILQWSAHINITGIKTIKGIIIKHFIDSLSIVEYLPSAGTLADLGSGGGFPGIPIKIVRPAVMITLIEIIRKKANFLKHTIRVLNLQGIEVYHGSAESIPAHKRFDCVVGRAFADLGAFLQAGSVLIKSGGLLIAMKSKKVETELDSAFYAQKKTGMVLIEKKLLSLPHNAGERSILIFKKNVSRETCR
jgi:16S rRNA (guanine527-N7)-methyltransferase